MNVSHYFIESYNALNNEQKKAVDAIDGPVMIIAGPGTGKTQILTLRIANILLKTDTEPENILALTFTEAGAHNMRKRLSLLIDNLAYRVVINTFHGFCNEVIRRYPEDFPRIIGSKAITELEAVKIVEEIIEKSSLVLLKPYGDRLLYVRDIVSTISNLKREGITNEKFSELIKKEKERFSNIEDLYHTKGAHKGKMKGDYIKLERKILKNEELSEVYRKYQESLTELKLYDFSDMILEVLSALENNPTLLQLLQEEYQYVLVDEHQDTNNAQNRILELLMNYHENPNLFVVGDQKQAIFRFQGASVENFHYFQKKYKNVELITLSQNYRSTQTVLNAAENLLPGDKSLQKNSSYVENKIRVGGFTTAAVERYFVAKDIETKIKNKVAPENIAILYRNNSQSYAISRDLSRLNIPYKIESDQDLFSQKDVSRLLIILQSLADFGNDIYLTKLLHVPFLHLESLDVYKIIRKANDAKKLSLYDVLINKEILEELNLTARSDLYEFVEKLKRWNIESKERDLMSFIEYIMRDSGQLEHILATSDMAERFNAINSFLDQVRQLVDRKPDATLEDLFVFLETIKKHNLYIKRQTIVSSKGSVRLMTVHKSKGLEFNHVYIINATNGIFGGKIDRDKLPLIESIYNLDNDLKISDRDSVQVLQNDDDERRLFYVALTRAKESVTILFSYEDDAHRETIQSEFVNEIDPILKDDIDTVKWEEKYKNDFEFQFSESNSAATNKQTSTNIPLNEKQFVNDLFLSQGLSPTALNNYLECPWKYFYLNLIRIPAVQNKHQCYGTAIHGSIADFFNQCKKEATVVGKDYLLASFERWINKVSFAPRDFEESKLKGMKALEGWYDCYQNEWKLNVQTEYRINGVMLDENIRITGVLDKIEWNEDDTVNIIDYKTGKPKSRNELMGTTKNSDGNYYRQLTFYKLLLRHFKEGQHIMRNGVIDFIEPDDKGKYHKECFEITEEEVDQLTNTILGVSDEIMNLSFWDKNCNNKDCEFCDMRKLIAK